MLRTRPARLSLWVLLPAAMAALAGFWGCGEQDLYKPPQSPYSVIGVLPMPSLSEDVSALGDYAFIAGGQAGIHAVDISDPTRPVLLQTLDTTKYAEAVVAAATPSAHGIIDIAFVVEGTEGITTYNISRPDSVYSFEQGATATDLLAIFVEFPEDADDPYVVYAAESWHGIRIFEQDPAIPGRLIYGGAFSTTHGYARDIKVRNGWAYVADDEMGLTVLDVRVRELGAVRMVSGIDSPGEARALALSGDHAYLADGEHGLAIFEIHEGDTPIPVSQLLLDGDCRDIEVRDQTAFLAAEDGGIHIVDVSNPASPQIMGTVVTGYATGLCLTNDGLVVVTDREQGLVILGGPGAFRDQTAPSAVRDLAAVPADSTSLTLLWAAPGNDQFNGQAASYDIRYSLSPITDQTWGSAGQAEGEPEPKMAGSREQYRLTGLIPDTDYYMALKSSDEAGNVSHLSNVALGHTPLGNLPPQLRDPALAPRVGDPSTLFVFEITYQDGEGDVPVRADLVLDGESLAMTSTGGDLTEGVVYRLETTVEAGSHQHYFAFDDGQGHEVETTSLDGPFVGSIGFDMGSPLSEPGRDADEVLHPVVFSRQVIFEDHEVTQSEFESLVEFNPSYFRGANLPVERVTWFDAVAYCNERSAEDGYTPAYELQFVQREGDHIISALVIWNREADGWRLPTESEWEYACRAGTQTAFANGDITERYCGDDPVLSQIGWYCGNSGNTTHQAKTAATANADGLYDMHGNVWEWCWDWYAAYPTAGAFDPQGPATGSQKVIRGGSWFYFAEDCRSASRGQYWANSRDNIVGFRVVRNAP